MISENTSLRGLEGQIYTLGVKVGSGGEGNVFLVQGQNLVAKIMTKTIVTNEQKLCYMVGHPISDLLDSDGVPILHLAWPIDVLYDENGRYAGYVMPFIQGGIEIFEIDRGCHSQKAKSLFPDYNWGLNVQVAHHLAMAVAYLHKHGCVIGDMNCKNILVNEKKTIIILDADSFDLKDAVNGIHYKCEVGTEDYLPPELQGRNLRTEAAQFNEQTDNFALAVHIFQLLMGNYHPFSCRQLTVAKNSSNANPRLEQIANGQSPYIHQYPGVDIPLGAPTIQEILPAYIHQKLVDTFDYDKYTAQERKAYRTSAEKWAASLERLRQECEAEGGLIQCEKDPTHYYLRSKRGCGFCKAKQRLDSVDHWKSPPINAQKEMRTTSNGRSTFVKDERVGRDSKYVVKGKKKRSFWVAAAILLAILLGYTLRDIIEPATSEDFKAETHPQATNARMDAYGDPPTEPNRYPEETEMRETTEPVVTMNHLDGIYVGTVSSGVPNGEGVLTWEEGSYEGQFCNGYPEGEGTFYYAEDSGIASISGQWSYGEALLKYESGIWAGDGYAQYTGMLLQAAPCGYGNLALYEGNSYRGTFANGHPKGQGTYYYVDGTKTSGIFTWGKDIMMSLHASRVGGTMYYTGMMKQNEPSGYGTLVFEKGGSFYGEFSLGSVDGTGIYVFRTPLAQNYDTIYGNDWSLVYGQHSVNYPDYEYSGLVLCGSWQGYGLGITPKKYHYVGEVRDNIRSGYGRLYTPDNQIYQEGMFSEGYLVK